MNEILGKVILIIGGIVIMLGGIWYIVNPKSAKKITDKHKGFDKYGKFRKSSIWEIRVMGIIILILGVLYEIGVFSIFGISLF